MEQSNVCCIWKSQFLIFGCHDFSKLKTHSNFLKNFLYVWLLSFCRSFFFKKKFCCISAGCQPILKNKVYSSIVISIYEYGSCVTLGAFFRFQGVIILVRKKREKCQKISRMSLNFDFSLWFLSTHEPFWWPHWKISWSFFL